MASVLTTAPFARYTLTYSAPGSAPGTPDGFGNPTYPPVTGTLTAFVAPDKARQLHLQPGADSELAPVKVELVKPLTLPAGVGTGSTLTLTYNGVECTVLVTSVIPNDLTGVPFGTLLLGELRPA